MAVSNLQSPNLETPHPASSAKPLPNPEDENAPETLRMEHSAGKVAKDAVIQPEDCHGTR